jgi:hypothetical protein
MTYQWSLVRTKPVGRKYGVALPAFIHNGPYFYTTVDVFSDGLINCWGFVDLSLFREKVARGWVVTQPPVAASLSVHNLGGAKAAAVEWQLGPEDLVSQVLDALDKLNPTRTGFVDMQGSDTELRGKVRYAKFGRPDSKPYIQTLDTGEDIVGQRIPIFEKRGTDYGLTQWFIYSNGKSRIGAGSALESIDDSTRRIKEGSLMTVVPNDSWIIIDGLGRFKTASAAWYVEPEERIREAHDIAATLTGEDGSIRRCINCHRDYEQTPNVENRERLREAYEAVPKHLRMYCGDMDSKDAPIRRILYGS